MLRKFQLILALMLGLAMLGLGAWAVADQEKDKDPKELEELNRKSLEGAASRLAEGPKGQEADDITGLYLCEGEDVRGQTYKGKAVIIKVGQVHRVRWYVGGETYGGAGIRRDDVFAVSWAGESGTGLMVYQIEKGEKGPKLVGQWTPNPPPGKLFEETLTFVQPLK